jgi:SRSO17 transposase
VLDERAAPLVHRLIEWLEPFKACFGHRTQLIALGQYVNGLLSDSPRKSMQAMLARVTDPTAYQTFHHFITHAPWKTDRVWRVLLAQLPARGGIVLLDDTGFPKKGKHSVGVVAQYCGTLGKTANCQVAVTAALWAQGRAWLIGAALYLPKEWTTEAARRTKVRIPADVRFQEKWRLALQLLRRARAAGLTVTAVVADAAYGDVTAFRTALHRLKLPYALGIACTTTVFRGTPHEIPPAPPTGRQGRPARWPRLVPRVTPLQVRTLAARIPAAQWHSVTWRNGTNAPRTALFAACRVTPAHDWREGRLAPEVWLLCERSTDPMPDEHFFLLHLPKRTVLRRLVELAHQRWAVEQQYQQLKTELGFDHFEGRTYPGWNHHIVLSAVAYAFLQRERIHREPTVTFETIHAIVQEIFTALLFAAHPRYLRWLQDATQLLPLRL